MRFGPVTGVRRRLQHVAIGLGIVLGPGVSVAQASAATLAVDKPCYVNKFAKTRVRQAPMQVSGSGYVPGDSVTISSTDGSLNTVVQASAAGTITVTIGAPTPFFKLPGSRGLALTATDYSNAQGTITAATLFKVTDLEVATVPVRARPSRKVTWYFSGFDPGRSVYGHYIRHGREVARAIFGRAQGDCGLVRVRARFFPGHQRYAHYALQFDDTRHYNPHSSPRIVTALNPQ
jgi:hypothetical protein